MWADLPQLSGLGLTPTQTADLNAIVSWPVGWIAHTSVGRYPPMAQREGASEDAKH